MLDQIRQLKEKAIVEISQTSDLVFLEKLEKKYLGRKGLLREILQKVGQLPEKEKPKIGQLINQTKEEIEQAIETKKSMLDDSGSMTRESIDVTLPGGKSSYGHLHPSSQLKNQVVEIFSSMGFEILEGLEVENEYYNFETLNISADHPARDMWDTFYLKSQILNLKSQKLLLRAHTSNMQVRTMEKRKPPLKVCVVGKCFRHEATDAKHEHTLYQIEGFIVDQKISMANLIYTLRTFLSALYKKDVKIRIRPAYFPFVEPGLEIDMACLNCAAEGGIHRSFSEGGSEGGIHRSFLAPRSFNEGGSEGGQLKKNKCPVCKGSGWIEILGAGMIHPKVFEYAGYPKGEYTGFAFGVGLDRLVMMKRQIDDIRWLHSGDLRFIRQF